MTSMTDSVASALAGRTAPDPRDSAAERLALHYAVLMDEAAPSRRYRKALAVLGRALAGAGYEEDDPDEALIEVAAALAEHTVTSDLGPKLLTTLASLGLTTTARGKAAEGGAPRNDTNPVDEIKARRARRLGNA